MSYLLLRLLYSSKSTMKTRVSFLLIFSILALSCGPKPYYKTREGKKKQKYYNTIPYQQP
jgi:hypothetical protein